MQKDFELHQQLANDTVEIVDLKLSKLLLMNSSYFPWVILVPMRNNMKEIVDLENEDQIILMQEIADVSRAIQTIFSPNKLNIAALGNIVEQLHIHIIARYKDDKAWPKPVFGHEVEKYHLKDLQNLIIKFRKYFNAR